MRSAATHFVRYVTAGMALTTCREPLLNSITSNLKTVFLQTLRVNNRYKSSYVKSFDVSLNTTLQAKVLSFFNIINLSIKYTLYFYVS